MMMMTVVRVCDDPRPVRTTIDRVVDAGRMRDAPAVRALGGAHVLDGAGDGHAGDGGHGVCVREVSLRVRECAAAGKRRALSRVFL